eukprot:CAMPEP_0113573206 /NCGR_PEP_ID=MMETSP0015_2-20120614/26492_1 /TAXON_ID=2838 /ORGANISM="Odontella" /LENGTH=1090 /DNA_ID=CAMNT_0000476265 /DNA_START=159 /DNA_END=3428 /DNA_ORIENTATION=- /assembly_acc=CAM_ASM_000160
MVENKRRKHHDKDKYYRLAKEQGLRSRAAFKLSQINRKFHLLENAKIVIDLCAAPGGWTQIASRAMPKSGSLVVAVDILPIRHINPNVLTLVGDITTDKCKSQIRSEMQGAAADVVLCDGAPNIGASYDRDAYQQNEIALHSLKCATEHLRGGGTFVTKMYRSQDYSSYLWVAKQFFKSVQAVKPAASRSQSAEIFLVCEGYLAPTKIDPRMLDPKCVFEQVDGQATGGGDARDTAAGKGKMNIFHKKYFEKRRQRQGYNMDVLDATMRNVGRVSDFIERGSGKDPIALLSTCTGLSFACGLCADGVLSKGDGEEDDQPRCNCKFFLEHSLTTAEIKTCVADLKVLNRSDFKSLLAWRTKMQDAIEETRKAEGDDNSGGEEDGHASEEDAGRDSEEEEGEIQKEIQDLRERKMRERKRQKKKQRKILGKGRRRADMGIDLNAFEVPDNDKIFSLASITNKGDLEAAREVDLSKFTDEQLFPKVDDDEDVGSSEKENGVVVKDEQGNVVAQGVVDEHDEDTGYSYRLDRELDEAYDRYLTNTHNQAAKTGTKMAKRSKKAQRQKAAQEAEEDAEMMAMEGVDTDTKRYAKMLAQGGTGNEDEGSSSDEDEDNVEDDEDGFHAEPATPQEHQDRRDDKKNKMEEVNDEVVPSSRLEGSGQLEDERSNPLIYKLPDDPASVKTARWFSNPLFESIGTAAKSASTSSFKRTVGGSAGGCDDDDYDSGEEANGDVESVGSDKDETGDPSSKRVRPKGRERGREEAQSCSSDMASVSKGSTLNADDVLAMMPKTDKQKRHEKRKKALERKERQMKRRAKVAGEEVDFEVAPAEGGNGDDDEKLAAMDEEQRKKVLESRALIKAGVGNDGTKDNEVGGGGFEVVSAAESRSAGAGPLPVKDERKYDSDHEEYDSDDYARTLALGTMMLRRSKAKALVDASYNRFAWNDPEDLPEWFIDDENRHYRPQLPIPPELVAKMKERQLAMSTKPIAKVAEARARKNKRAKTKLSAAKKKAEAVANSSELSEAMKLKAISKAMRGQDAKRPGKTYVISKKGGKTKGGKGIKLVDRRMVNDKRSMDRATKKRKKGKQGGLTGSK